MTLLEGYSSATWRRQTLRLLADERGWSDRRTAIEALKLTDDDLRAVLYRRRTAIRIARRLRQRRRSWL